MIQSRWSKMFGILPLTLAFAGLAGCNDPQDAADESTDVASSELQGAPPAAAKDGKSEHARPDGRGHARGPTFLLNVALRELDLTDAQKATIKAEIDAFHSGTGDHRADHDMDRKALADAIRAGKVDEAAFAKAPANEPADQARMAKALTVLHATLDAKQRQALVDAVVAMKEKHGGPEGKGARDHGDKGERGHDGDRGDRRGAGKHGGDKAMRGPMGHLLRGIELSDAQQTQVSEAFAKMAPSEADREAMKARHEAGRKAMSERLATFASDHFDASAFVAMPADAAMRGPEGKHGGMVKALAVIVPILDATQRAELAKRIEEGTAAHGGKGKHGRKGQ